MNQSHERLITELTREGYLREPWANVMRQVPRKDFVPVTTWIDTVEGPQIIDRDSDPDEWLTATCEDIPIVTQWNDGASPPGDISDGTPTSSISQPSIVATMLDETMIEHGDRVLEIGTGTGWNAALLATFLGDENAYTVEVDPVIADRARVHLSNVGRHPMVICGDGMVGHPADAPYDRVLSTASVFTVPYAWVEQTRPGGYVVTPWRTALINGLLLRLVVKDDGSASGQFVSTASFMPARSQRAPTEDVDISGPGTDSITATHPSGPLDVDHAQYAIGMLVPDCYQWLEHGSDGYVVRLEDAHSKSWATVTVTADMEDSYPVRQGGPRLLWDEIEAAYEWWKQIGRPEFTRFGVTVDQDGQRVWLDDPGNRISPIP